MNAVCLKSTLSVPFVALLLCMPAQAKDSNETEIRRLKEEISAAADQIIRNIDPAAQVVVKVTRERSNLDLPGTPFSMKNVDLDALTEAKLDKVGITVFIAIPKLPKGAKRLLEEVVAEFAHNIAIEVKRLPKDYVEAHRKVNRNQLGAIQESPPSKLEAARASELKSWESPLSELLRKLLATFKSGEDGHLDSWRQATGRIVLFVSLCLSGVLTLLALVLYFYMKMQLRLANALDRGFRDMSEAFASTATPAPKAIPAADSIHPQSRPILISAEPDHYFTSIPEDGLLALLTDCYWTSQDHYASFLWRRIPFKKKLDLIHRFGEQFSEQLGKRRLP